MMRERPLVGGGEGAKTHSPLCRTKPSGRGVAPATTPVAGVPPRIPAAVPQDTVAPADRQEGRVNRRRAEV